MMTMTPSTASTSAESESHRRRPRRAHRSRKLLLLFLLFSPTLFYCLQHLFKKVITEILQSPSSLPSTTKVTDHQDDHDLHVYQHQQQELLLQLYEQYRIDNMKPLDQRKFLFEDPFIALLQELVHENRLEEVRDALNKIFNGVEFAQRQQHEKNILHVGVTACMTVIMFLLTPFLLLLVGRRERYQQKVQYVRESLRQCRVQSFFLDGLLRPNEPKTECPICLEPLTMRDTVIASSICGCASVRTGNGSPPTAFHEECAERWLLAKRNTSYSCPCCRLPMIEPSR